MKAKTRLFGEIDIADEKLIVLEKGMIGFPNLVHFALIFDEETQLLECGFCQSKFTEKDLEDSEADKKADKIDE